jgi:hypothetical protein
MMRLAAAGLLAAALSAPACTERRGTRCETICKRESDCAEKLRRDDIEVDEAECVEKCRQLERDDDGKKAVADHAACVDGAADCNALLACP